jgi:hypothetical protein
MQLITGKFLTSLVAVAAHLRFADHLASGPRTSAEIAQAAGSNPDATYRVLRALAMVGVFVERDGKVFELTPVGQLLRSDAPGSLAAMATFMGEPWHSAAWGELLHAVTTGGSAFQRHYGAAAFDWLVAHPREMGVFANAMSSFSNGTGSLVAASYDFSASKRIADVGGGHGVFLATLLAANPGASGVLFDLPPVVAGAGPVLAERGVADRCTVQGGSFFEQVPTGCDTYVLKHIMHDWDDASCEKILGHIARALPDDGRLFVVEQVMTAAGVPHFSKLIDIEMLVVTDNGRERTEAEFAALFEKVGLALRRVIPLPSPVSILEVTKA